MTKAAYERLRKEGYELAGGLDDLVQRASMYHSMFVDSGRRNVFPLIAAHGALWGSGYFKRGIRGGKLLSVLYLLTPARRAERLNALIRFADQFKDINRRVCAESYAMFHYTRLHGGSCFIRSRIGDDLADILCACHASADAGVPFPPEQRERLFVAFFHWEQNEVVGPAVSAAYAQFDWGLVKFFALRPRIRFSYFSARFCLKFDHFGIQEQRVAHGLAAYHQAELVGLDHVEKALAFYRILPPVPQAAAGIARSIFSAVSCSGLSCWSQRARSKASSTF
jgi:hypothetical protein